MKLLPFKSRPNKNRTILKVFFVSLYSCTFNEDDPVFINCSIVSVSGDLLTGCSSGLKIFGFIFSVITMPAANTCCGNVYDIYMATSLSMSSQHCVELLIVNCSC